MKRLVGIVAVFLLGMISGLVLPQLPIWPYSACHWLGGAIDVVRYNDHGQPEAHCVIPWTNR